MTKTYDPQYSTQVAFNTPIMEAMLEKRDTKLVIHWFENGEPNKNLAAAALNKMLRMQWIDGLELLWNVEWLTKKAFLSKSWLSITCSYSYFYNDPLAKTETEQWLINKTYNEKVLSANEINNLHLNILEKTSSDYYWNMFFTSDLKMKGKTSHTIFQHVKYFAYYDKTKGNKLEKSVNHMPVMKQRLIDIIKHKNGFEIPYYQIFDVLIDCDDIDMFWLILNNKVIMNQKELFLTAALGASYFNIAAKILKKMNQEDIKKVIDDLAKSLVKLGLKESVEFTVKDFSDEYKKIFENGYPSLSNINKFSGYGFNTTTYQFERVETYYNSPNLKDVTFYAGDALFAKPSKSSYKEEYKKLTETEKQEYRNKFKEYLK